jgi:hypothetical protein
MKLKTCYGFRWMESAAVKVGPFARGGKSRVPTKAADHDAEAASHGDARRDFPAHLR